MKKLILFSILILSKISFALEISRFHAQSSSPCDLRIAVSKPTGEVKADLLFLHGFADRADNHAPLFNLLNELGIRVISFDYPSHGETRCGSIDGKGVEGLLDLASQVEKSTREDKNRSFYLSGWSTGGLLALRALSLNTFAERKIAALILLAPGVALRNIVGDKGIVTVDSLLSNPQPPHMAPPSPRSPYLVPVFSADLWIESRKAFAADYPKIPMLTIFGGVETDLYVKTTKAREWISSMKTRGQPIQAMQCGRSKHELDNEIEPIGTEVRNAIKSFIRGEELVNDRECAVL